MDAKQLLNALTKQKLLDDETVEGLLRDVETSRKPIEELIYERQLVKDQELTRVKSELIKIPAKKLDANALSPELMQTIPEDTVSNYKVVPISKAKGALVVGMLYPEDEKAQEVLRFIAKQNKTDLGVYLISRTDYEAALRKYFPYLNEISAALRFIRPEGQKSASSRRVVRLEEGGASGEEAPIIKIVASTLREAVVQGASDIHIEPQRNRLRIRFRLDGDLHEVISLPAELQQAIVSRVKVLSNLQIDETRRPQDGRFRTVILGKDIDFRVATFPTPVGEKAALRVLDPTVGLKGLEDLGIQGPNRTIIDEGMKEPYGMMLLTGPTGSGKTTTLYALMQILNTDEVNIVSLEDPVEYFIDGLNQSQVRPDLGYDFASGLRQILRQDPDVMMIGEIRDAETAKLSVHAALTGHTVLSTLHTNNAVGVVPRLLDMGVDKFLLPSAINLMAAQRLVGRLCANCRKESELSQKMSELIKKEIDAMPEEGKKLIKKHDAAYTAPGCSVCKGRGRVGRVALFEVFKMTRELSDILQSGANEGKIFDEARRQGMLTLRQDGIIKALQGLVSLEDVLHETSEL